MQDPTQQSMIQQSETQTNFDKKIGAVVVIIGRQGSGKTPTALELCNSSNYKNKIVYDPRHETHHYNHENFTVFHKMKNFKNYVLTTRNSFIIAEEATGFIGSFRDMDIEEWLISVEHYRNVIVFLFHSIIDTPQFILRKAHYTILLKTNDDPELVKRSRPEMYKHVINPNKPLYLDNYR